MKTYYIPHHGPWEILTATESACVQVESRDGIGWIRLDHPPLNIITIAMARQVRAAVETFDADRSGKIIVVTAVGDRAFAAGADVGEHTLEKVRELNDELFALARTLTRPDGKPRIAAVKGICCGGANEVAFACDFVIARDDTRFSLPEIKIGAVGSFGAFMMARFMSSGKALELALSGEWLTAAEAQGFGLVAQVLPRAGFEVALQHYLERFTDKSMAAMRVGRKHLRTVLQPPTDAALAQLSRYLMGESIELEDYHEGVEAFLQKRKPVWRDR